MHARIYIAMQYAHKRGGHTAYTYTNIDVKKLLQLLNVCSYICM